MKSAEIGRDRRENLGDPTRLSTHTSLRPSLRGFRFSSDVLFERGHRTAFEVWLYLARRWARQDRDLPSALHCRKLYRNTGVGACPRPTCFRAAIPSCHGTTHFFTRQTYRTATSCKIVCIAKRVTDETPRATVGETQLVGCKAARTCAPFQVLSAPEIGNHRPVPASVTAAPVKR